MGFCSLQHLRNRRSTHRELCLPATFRLQGLTTLLTVSSLRSRAGSISTRQRSWDSPFGAFSSQKVRRRSRPSAPTYRFADGCSHTAEAEWPAPQAAVPGLSPFRESLAPGRVFSAPDAGCSPGFPLRGHAGDSLDRDFARSPLTRFTRQNHRPRGTAVPPAGATEYRSAAAWPHSDLRPQAAEGDWSDP